MDDDNNSLFRAEALKNFNVISQLNQSISIVSRWSWLPVCAVGLIIVSLILWGIFGSIPTRIKGEGILLVTNGNLYNAIAPDGDERITGILVKPGDRINKDEIIAYLDMSDLQGKLTVAKSYLIQLQNEYKELTEQFKNELEINTQQINEQNKILQKIIVAETENFQYVKTLLATKKLAFSKGLITQQEVANTLQSFYNIKNSIDESEKSLSENKTKQSDFLRQWKDRLNSLELKVQEQEYKVNDLQVKFNSDKTVKSPISGIIINIQTNVGEKVESGQVIATIAPLGKDLDAVVYVPAQNGKRIKTGMNVLISPSTIKKEEFGSIKGEVEQVSAFPSTEKTMFAVLQNQDLVKEFSKEGVTIAVRVHLKKDTSTFSGYAWTSSQGPEQEITAGTIVNVLITVRTQAPVTLIIPGFKKLLGE